MSYGGWSLDILEFNRIFLCVWKKRDKEQNQILVLLALLLWIQCVTMFQVDLKETIMFLSIRGVIGHLSIYAEMVVFPQEAN